MKSRNYKVARALQFALAVSLVGIVVSGASKQTQTVPNRGKQSPPLIRSLKGPDLYLAYCASCHGLDARGTGPAVPALKTKMPDLTLLSKNNQGSFPTAYVRQVITGELVVSAHGSREMPIWGPIFHQVEANMDWGDARITILVNYLQSRQYLAPAKIPSGEELYEQDCALCHGHDLKGARPDLPPFTAPPDLTMLARKHGGTFPEDYVMNIVETGSAIPAHGPTQMPIWGTDFTRNQWGEQGTALRIANLLTYIKSRQEK
jgi:mono/diheme cytochrome c family protein